MVSIANGARGLTAARLDTGTETIDWRWFTRDATRVQVNDETIAQLLAVCDHRREDAERPADPFEPTGRLPGRSACPRRRSQQSLITNRKSQIAS